MRTTAPEDGAADSPRRRAGKWALGAAVAALVLVAPVVLVANAVSDRGGSDRSQSGPDGLTPGATLPPGWKLAWHDEFEGTALDAAKWMTCPSGSDVTKPCKGATEGEQQRYIPEQVRVADGSLQLTAQRKATDGAPFASGAVSTGAVAGESFDKSRRLFEPGTYIEARVRLAPGAALWPAMRLRPMVPGSPSRPEVGVFEFGGEQQLAHARLQATGPCRASLGDVLGDNECHGQLGRTGTHFVDDYRLFGIDWQPERLTYYADGEPILTVVGDAVPREKMYLAFDLAVGGVMGGDTSRTPDTSTMAIDYVRAWAGRGQSPVGAPGNGAVPSVGATAPASTPTTAPSSAPASSPLSPSATPNTSAPPSKSASTTPPPPRTSPPAPTTTPPASPPPPAPPQGDPWLEFLAPADYSSVKGVITVKVRVNGPRERVQEVSFYVNSKNCDSPKGDAEWLGMDRDNDKDGVYVFNIDTRPLDNGCNTISTVGIDVADEYRYYPPVGRVHLDVYVAN